MITFLTSSPTGPLDNSRIVDGFDDKNRLVINLRRRWKDGSRCLLLPADPDDSEFNDIIRDDMVLILNWRGFPLSSFDVWDCRSTEFPREELLAYDFILLGGGHVPTQNAFFQKAGLREKMRGFEGIVMGISAGTMNCADMVYAQPELPGESIDPNYMRHFEGLDLTKLNILPHYQAVRNSRLDGKRLYEDITYADSRGHSFLVLPDGSYVLGENGHETLFGEAWRIADGRIEKICRDGQTLALY
ncbi:MAG: Type 1 glutamine amidotransferase-like domain-containing protein [Mailhella sp.]|nr:Type 1 glutamine amidotransferase-like domain-containing protein [Mailhella sp.]